MKEMNTNEKRIDIGDSDICLTKDIFVIFDESSPLWINDFEINKLLIKAVIEYHDRYTLPSKSCVFLDDIVKSLGIESRSEYKCFGWLDKDPNGCPNYIDFTIGERSFMDTNDVLITFTVDGIFS